MGALSIGTHNMIQFFGHFRESPPLFAWSINLAFYTVTVVCFNQGELNLLRAGHRMKASYWTSFLFVLVELGLLGAGYATRPADR